ncbi:MAG: ABC transporter permease subunit [Dehalococcoidia bacterium]
MTPVIAIMRKELADAGRGRWLPVFAGAFAVVALVLCLVQATSGDLGSQGFNRTTAGLINLCLLLVPLLALVLGAGTIAGERDRGTLATLLAQPISAAELVLGKFAGLNLAVWSAIALGFGGAGIVMALLTPLTDARHYLVFVALAGVLATATLSAGMLVSVLSDGRMKALAIAIVLWFAMVLFYDLAAIGLALAFSPSGRGLLVTVLGNPVETVRILAVFSLEPDLEVLGPVGAYLVEELGLRTAIALLAGALVTWISAPLLLAMWLLGRQDA